MEEVITIRDVADVPWTDVERVFGTRGDPAGCWCQFYKIPSRQLDEEGPEGCSARLREQVAASSTSTPSPGLIAYAGDEPVGWIAVEPRINFPIAVQGKVVTGGSSEASDDSTVWAVVCFVVRVGFRRRGIGATLITAAVDQARAGGARILEGYPVDVTAKPKISSADLYHGTLSMFERAGFDIVARPLPGRALVSLTL